MMNKREFSKIARPVATEAMVLLAERTENDNYIATVEKLSVAGEEILLLNFFKRSQLIQKKTGAALRTFLSHDDYITQDLSTTRTKWLTGSFTSIFEWRFWNSHKYNIVFASNRDYQIAKKFMKRYLGGAGSNVWEAIESFQSDVIQRRLMQRHKKETDRIDKKMELISDLPDGFREWAHDTAMADKRYLIYEAGKKKILHGYCTCCKKQISINTKQMKPRNKQRGKCPACGGEVTFIPKGYFPTYQRDSKWACLIQKVETGIVLRYFHVHQEIQRDNLFKEVFGFGEFRRTFYEEDNVALEVKSYEWDVYKQRGPCRWCPDGGKHNSGLAVLYTNNLPEVLENSIYKYCAIDLYQEKCGCEPIPVYRYMSSYPDYRFLEYFVKAGLTNMVNEVVGRYCYSINERGKTPTDILGIPKSYIKILIELNGADGELRLLKQCAADNVLPKADEIGRYYNRFGGNDELIGVINGHMSIDKFVRYMDKQKKMQPHKPEDQDCHAGWMSGRHYTKEEREQQEYKNLAKDWLDYISWSCQLKYDMHDPYVILPPDFRKAHDRLMVEYTAHKEELAQKKRIEMEKQIKSVLELVATMPAIGMQAKGLMMVLPKNGEEIVAEGRALHHCVGTYVERVAKGETMILFIRRMEKPEEPYFTLEFQDGKVIQCRGKNNCSMNKEVSAFVKAFEVKMSPKKKKEASGKRKAG